MKKFQLNKQKLNLKTLTTPLLALSLMAGCAGLFGGSAFAVSVPLVYDPDATNSTITSLGGTPGDGNDLLSVSDGVNLTLSVNIFRLDTTCPQDVTSVYLSSNYTLSSEVLNNQSDGVSLYVAKDLDFPAGIWDNLSVENGHPYTYSALLLTQGYLPPGETEGSGMISGTWTNSTSSSVIYIGQVADTNDVSSGGHIAGATSSITVPTADVTYSPTSSCAVTNTPPTITSGSGATASVTIPENTTAVTTVTATDADTLDTLSYSITGGTDQSKFTINPATGELTLNSAPDYENPTDSDNNNTYQVEVTVSDGNGGTAIQTITVTITDVNESTALYCPSPYDATTLLTPSGDCDEDGITNQTEGFDPDGDGNPSTGTAPIDTDGDSIPDYLDLDTDNDGILDTEEKGTLANSSTNPSDVDSDGTPDFRDLDSDNDSTKDIKESGRNYTDTNNDGKVDGSVNTYGIPSSAASTTNPKTLASTSLKDSDNNGTPDYRQSSRNGVSVLAKTGDNLKAITIVSVMALGLAGYVKLKNKNSKSYRRR